MDNKISGMPFIPKGGTYPVSTVSGEKLYLLIQLNFETLPHLENYPEKGILQIFIGASDVYGANFDDSQSQDDWRVLYYPDITDPMSEEEIQAVMPGKPEEDFGLPFEKFGREFKLEYTEEEMAVTVDSFNFIEILNTYCRDILGDEYAGLSWYDLPDELTDGLYDQLSGEGTRLGGYPGFTQYDPREGEFENYELLLQIDSEGEDKESYLMWGDCGIANFFIDPEDLKKCDFSKVIYNWDCC
ncbi:MAG: DUF1963 domain-containing protein [Lachnospiraceae bacterium]|nr:DUF1963 domain-containing protein [Lachnospiraceae bacterium]